MAALKSALTLVNNALDELGQSQVTALFGITTDAARLYLRLFNRQGKALRDANEKGWVVQQRTYTFPTVASTAEYALPTDYDHLLNDTVWDRTLTAPAFGVLSPAQWQVIKSGGIGAGAYSRRYRIVRSQVSGVDRKFIIDPTPTAVETVAFEYISTDWLEKSDHSVTYDEIAADTNLVMLDQTLMELGFMWRWRRSRGMEFMSLLAEYNELLDYKIANDKTALDIDLAQSGSGAVPLLGYQNIPETGFGS